MGVFLSNTFPEYLAPVLALGYLAGRRGIYKKPAVIISVGILFSSDF